MKNSFGFKMVGKKIKIFLALGNRQKCLNIFEVDSKKLLFPEKINEKGPIYLLRDFD